MSFQRRRKLAELWAARFSGVDGRSTLERLAKWLTPTVLVGLRSLLRPSSAKIGNLCDTRSNVGLAEFGVRCQRVEQSPQRLAMRHVISLNQCHPVECCFEHIRQLLRGKGRNPTRGDRGPHAFNKCSARMAGIDCANCIQTEEASASTSKTRIFAISRTVRPRVSLDGMTRMPGQCLDEC